MSRGNDVSLSSFRWINFFLKPQKNLTKIFSCRRKYEGVIRTTPTDYTTFHIMESFFIFFYTIGDECYDLTSFFQWVTEKHGRQWYMWYHKAFPRKLVIILLLFLGHMRVSWDHVIFTNIYSKLILKEWLPIKSVGKVRQWNSYSFVKIVGILDFKKNLVILLNINCNH